MTQYLNLGGFLIFGLVFLSRDVEVGTNICCKESTVSPRMGLIVWLRFVLLSCFLTVDW